MFGSQNSIDFKRKPVGFWCSHWKIQFWWQNFEINSLKNRLFNRRRRKLPPRRFQWRVRIDIRIAQGRSAPFVLNGFIICVGLNQNLTFSQLPFLADLKLHRPTDMPKKKPQKVKAPAEPTPEELAAQARQKLIDEMKALKGEFTTELKLINGYQQSKVMFWFEFHFTYFCDDVQVLSLIFPSTSTRPSWRTFGWWRRRCVMTCEWSCEIDSDKGRICKRSSNLKSRLAFGYSLLLLLLIFILTIFPSPGLQAKSQALASRAASEYHWRSNRCRGRAQTVAGFWSVLFPCHPIHHSKSDSIFNFLSCSFSDQHKYHHDFSRASETETKREQRALATLTREMELSHAELLQELKLTQEKHIMATRQEYERRADEMKQACEKKMKAVWMTPANLFFSFWTVQLEFENSIRIRPHIPTF